VTVTPRGPRSESAAELSRSTPSWWLTAGGTPAVTETSTPTQNGRTIWLISSGISC
jgi:hypothetical protein